MKQTRKREEEMNVRMREEQKETMMKMRWEQSSTSACQLSYRVQGPDDAHQWNSG